MEVKLATMKLILPNFLKGKKENLKHFPSTKHTEEATRNRVKYRKNFLPLIIVIIFFLILAIGEVYFVDPFTPGALPLFFLIVFLGLFFLFSTIFAHSRRGFLAASILTVFLILRYLGVGTIFNFLLLLAIAVSLETYLVKR